jgi:outer membrane protein assembly factor BamE (lipoprotein component of BamABCDE complex)
MNHAISRLAVLMLAAALAACGTTAPRLPAKPQPASPAVVMDAVKPGTSTRDEVATILGKPRDSVVFDSGYEVWVYEFKPTLAETGKPNAAVSRLLGNRALRGKTEVVVLFAPSGVATKMRLRPIPEEVAAAPAQ